MINKWITILLLLFALMGSIHAEESKTVISGNLEANFTSVFDDTMLYSDVEALRLGISRDFKGIGGMETEMIYNTGFSFIDPTVMFKDSSVFETIIMEKINELSLPYMGMMDSSTGLPATGDPYLDTLIMHLAMALPQEQLSMDDLPISDLAYSSYATSDNFKINKAIIKIFTKPADFYIGKQQMGWGTGYAWNPTDIFNAKDPLDPQASKLGVLSMRSEIGLPGSGLMSVVLIPGFQNRRFSGGARIQYSLPWFDLSLSGARYHNSDRALFGLPPKIQVGMDMAGEVTEKAIGFVAEGCFVNPAYTKYTEFDSAYAQGIFGLNYTFENGIYLMGEYYYNGLGNADAEYRFQDLLYLISGDMAGLAQHYLMVGTTKNVYEDLIGLQLFSNINLVDGSFALIPAISYSFANDISIDLGSTFFIGDIETEYGSFKPTAYLKTSVFF